MTRPMYHRPSRATTPQQDEVLRRAFMAGARVRDLADAYGLSLRTAYRAIARAGESYVEVVAGDWRATFVLTDDGPFQATAWTPAP